MPAVEVDVRDGVAVLTLNRPDVLNVFSAELGAALGAAYRRCDEDDGVRAVVLTGAGRAFCAGADLSPDAGSFTTPGEGFSASPVEPPAWAVRKPVIAAVNGHALGIGCTLALQCDLRYVADDAKLGVPQVRFGMLGDAGSHWTLRAATSQAVAADLLLTGRTVLGDEAVRLGIASRVLPAAEVLPAAVATAREIAERCAPLSVALSKRLLWAGLDRDGVVRRETAYHEVVMGTPDAVEGPRAWQERRPPQWSMTVTGSWDRVMHAEEPR